MFRNALNPAAAIADSPPYRREVSMNLSGTLSDWTVADLLNVMKVTGKTASLHIHGKRGGVLHFSKGRVVGATLDGNSIPDGEVESRAVASETLFVLSGLEDGSFEIGAFEGTEGEGWDVDWLLSDMDQLNGLESDLTEAGIGDALLMLRDEIKKPITVQVEDWWAIASLVSVLSFDQLEDVFGRGRAIRLLHTLWRMDLVETIEEGALPVEEEPAADESVPMVMDERPASLDLSELSEPATEPEPELEPEPESEEEVATIGPADERDDESWLDEIAAAAEASSTKAQNALVETRHVMGVSAPASTVLTGAVLDEMRRLRVRPAE